MRTAPRAVRCANCLTVLYPTGSVVRCCQCLEDDRLVELDDRGRVIAGPHAIWQAIWED